MIWFICKLIPYPFGIPFHTYHFEMKPVFNSNGIGLVRHWRWQRRSINTLYSTWFHIIMIILRAQFNLTSVQFSLCLNILHSGQWLFHFTQPPETGVKTKHHSNIRAEPNMPTGNRTCRVERFCNIKLVSELIDY